MESPMIHIVFLKANKNEEGLRPIISYNIEDVGLTFEQALEVCLELNNHQTIAAWLTSGVKEPIKEG